MAQPQIRFRGVPDQQEAAAANTTTTTLHRGGSGSSSGNGAESSTEFLTEDATYLAHLDSTARRTLFNPAKKTEEIFRQHRGDGLQSWFLSEFADPIVEQAFMVHATQSTIPVTLSGIFSFLAQFITAFAFGFVTSGHWSGMAMIGVALLGFAVAVINQIYIGGKVGGTQLEDEYNASIGNGGNSSSQGGSGGVAASSSSGGTPPNDNLLDSHSMRKNRRSSVFGDGSITPRGPSVAGGAVAGLDGLERKSAYIYPKLCKAVNLYDTLTRVIMLSGVFQASWVYPMKTVCFVRLGAKAFSEAQLYRLCLSFIFPWTLFYQVLPMVSEYPRPNRCLPIVWATPLTMFFMRWVSGPWEDELTRDLLCNIFVQLIACPLLITGGIMQKDRWKRNTFKTFIHLKRLTLEVEKQNSAIEKTLQVVLPATTMAQLRDGLPPFDHSEMCSVIVCNIDGFKKWSTSMMPALAVKSLDALFILFDKRCGEFDARKVKTVGDCYLAAHGLEAAEESKVADSSFNQQATLLAASNNAPNNGVLGTKAGGDSDHSVASVNSGVFQPSATYASTNALHMAQWMVKIASLASASLVLKTAVHSGWCFGGLVGGHRSSLWYEIHGEAVDVALGLVKAAPGGSTLTTRQTLSHSAPMVYTGRSHGPVLVNHHDQTVSINSYVLMRAASTSLGGSLYVQQQESSGVFGSPGGAAAGGDNPLISGGGGGAVPSLLPLPPPDGGPAAHSSSSPRGMVHNSSQGSVVSSTSGGTVKQANDSTSSAAHRQKLQEAQDRHRFLRLKVLGSSGPKHHNSSPASPISANAAEADEGFFGLEAASKVVQLQTIEKRGFNYYFTSDHLEAQWQEARNSSQAFVIGIRYFLASTLGFLFMDFFLEVGNMVSRACWLLSIINMLGLDMYLSHVWSDIIDPPNKKFRKTPPIFDILAQLVIYTIHYFGMCSMGHSAMNNSMGYIMWGMQYNISLSSIRAPWWMNTFLFAYIYIGAFVADTFVNQRSAQDIIVLAPIMIVSYVFVDRWNDKRRRKYFRDKQALLSVQEAAANELTLFKQLVRLLVPASVVDIVVAKAANKRSPCVESLGEVCVAGLEVSINHQHQQQMTSSGNNPSTSILGGGGGGGLASSVRRPRGNSNVGGAPNLVSSIAMTEDSLTPLERFRQLESVFVTIEETLAASKPSWSRASVDAPLVERMYTLGDRIFFAGPLRENPTPERLTTNRPLGQRSELVQTAALKHEDKEDVLFSASIALCNLVHKLRKKYSYSEFSMTAVLHQGPSFAAVIGFSRPTFHLLGPALQVTEALLEHAPKGYIGCTDKFYQLLSHGIGGAPLIESDNDFASGSFFSHGASLREPGGPGSSVLGEEAFAKLRQTGGDLGGHAIDHSLGGSLDGSLNFSTQYSAENVPLLKAPESWKVSGVGLMSMRSWQM